MVPVLSYLALAGEAWGQVHAAAGLGSNEPDVSLPPVAARPPAGFAEALASLPPGIRFGAGLKAPEAESGSRLVERIGAGSDPSPSGTASVPWTSSTKRSGNTR